MQLLQCILVLTIIGCHLDISSAQVISYFKMGREQCSTKCTSGYLKEFDTCVFNFEISFNETLPDLSSVNIELKGASSGIYNPLYTLGMKEDCDGYKENSEVYCTELDKNLFSIAIKADKLSRYSEANIRVYITTPNVPKVFSEILKFPRYYDTKEALGHLKINGGSFLNETFCNITTNEKELQVEFDCISEALPCLIQIKKNGELIVGETNNSITWKETIESSSTLDISIQYSACRLDGEYKQINCVYRTVKTELVTIEDSLQTSLILGIAISIGILVILIGIVLIYWFRCRKHSKHQDAMQSGPLISGTGRTRASEDQRTSDQVNIKEHEGWTALMLASEKGNTKIVKQLVEAGADIDVQNENGWTALMFAARNGHKDIVKYLISKNANVNIKEVHGWSALTVGAKKGKKEIVRAISRKSQAGYFKIMKEKVRDRDDYKQFDKLNRNRKSVFENNSTEKASENTPLLKENDITETKPSNEGNDTNADVNTTCEIETETTERKVPGAAPISRVRKGSVEDVIKAARKGNKKNLPFLKSQRVNFDSKTEDGLTPLMIISQDGNKQGVDLLLSFGANIDVASKDKGLTALMFACHKGHTETAKALIEGGADVNIRDKQGWTALMHAVKDDHTDIATLLIARKAVTKEGVTQELEETNEENDSVFVNDSNKVANNDTINEIVIHRDGSEDVPTETEGNDLTFDSTIDATSNEIA